MKRTAKKLSAFLVSLTCTLCSLSSIAQTVPVYADTTSYRGRSAGNEIQIRNSTKAIKGYLFNYDGNGNTSFKAGIDTQYIIGDTLYWKYTDGDSIYSKMVRGVELRAIDTGVIRRATTINFVGDFAGKQLPAYPVALSFITGKQVLAYGVSGETSPQILARFVTGITATPAYLNGNYGHIWEAGRNNLANLAQMQADAQAFVDTMTAHSITRYVILSVFNQSGENPSATSTSLDNYNAAIDFNTWAAATFPGHFVDSRTNNVNRYNSQLAQDVTDYGNDTPPLSLRNDALHPNKYGADFIAIDLAAASALSGSTAYVCWGNSFTYGSYPPFPYGYTVAVNNRQHWYSSTDVFTTFKAKTYNYNALTVINMYRPTDYNDTATVHHNIDSIVSYVGTNNYVVYGLILADTITDRIGGSRRAAVLGLNSSLSAQYGAHYFDLHAYLLSHYTPSNPRDVTDVANGVVPSTLKIDSVNLNETGQTYVLTKVVQQLPSVSASNDLLLANMNIQDILSSPPVIGKLNPNEASFTKLSLGTNSTYAYPLNIQAIDLGHIGINGTSIVYYPNQTHYNGSLFYGNGGFNLVPGAIQNTATGIYSGASLTTGSLNTLDGFQAGAALTSGSSNTAVGNTALRYTTIGVSNTGVGNRALYSNTEGNRNTALGEQALYLNTTGLYNTAVGWRSLFVAPTAQHNTGLGYATLVADTSGAENTAVGSQSMYNNLSGGFNTASGYNSLFTNITGSQNTATGSQALFANLSSNLTATGFNALGANTTGTGNVANGWRSMNGNLTGNNNTAGGYQSLYTSTANNNNTAFGYVALKFAATDDNSAFGYSALTSLTSGQRNSAFGSNALWQDSSGSNNSAFGFQAAYGNRNTTYNAAFGANSLFGTTTGSQNTGIGGQALFTNTTGADNSATGYQSLFSNTTGGQNTANGRQALFSNTTASNNTASGYRANFANTTGTGNVAFGYLAHANNTTGSHSVVIGDNAALNDTLGTGNTVLGGSNTASGLNGDYNTVLGGAQTGFSTGTSNMVSISDGQGNKVFISPSTHNVLLAGLAVDNATDKVQAASFGVGYSGSNAKINLYGSTSGQITIQPSSAAGTYNFNLPTTAGTSGQPLLSGGGSGTAMTFGTLGVAGGGTGITSGTSGGIPYFSSSSAIASSAALAANALVIGGGAGAAPSTTATGTGVLTFLGTPSSANLAAAITDETGSGAAVFGTNPTVGGITFTDATDIVFNTTTGTKIGTGTTQKLAFYNSTPIVKPSGSILTALSNLGLVASPTATLAGSDFANQGTTTTVLHGNASGNPSWSSIVNADIDAAAAITIGKMSYTSNSIAANTTGSTAAPTAITFKDVAEQTYSGTIAWTGGAAPSSTTSHHYRWSQMGNLVTLTIELSYAVAGTTNTQVTMDLPGDLPTPTKPTGFTSNGDILYWGSGAIGTSTAVPASSTRAGLVISAGGVYQCFALCTSASAKTAWVTVQYYTN